MRQMGLLPDTPLREVYGSMWMSWKTDEHREFLKLAGACDKFERSVHFPDCSGRYREIEQAECRDCLELGAGAAPALRFA